MAKTDFFKEDFDALATEGYIGDPNGKLGYAYLRVSSAGQAEEGRSGLPRQIARVHEAATKHGIKIPWEMVFADDHTGFEFKDRPKLSKLRHEYKNPNRQGDTIVIEYLDRLSRNADWHQGFLLDEMSQHQMQVIFWKGFSSRIERAVMGAISQDGMERELQNMHEGKLNKARSGRVTAKTRAYGYIFVDAEGKQSPKVKKETYYAPHPEESEIIKLIFHRIGIEGWSARQVAAYLEGRFPPPGKWGCWSQNQVCLFIRKPLYKGLFICNRHELTEVPAKNQRPHEPLRMIKKKVPRPPEEWIYVPVPPLVSEELWDMANRLLDKNAQMAKRNAKVNYLLTGLIKCSGCGSTYVGSRTKHKSKNGIRYYFRYRCVAQNNRDPHIQKMINCSQPMIKVQKLEDAVWSCICKVLLTPKLLLDALDRELTTGENAGLKQQIAFIERQIEEKKREDDKLYRAYLADVFDAEEFSARRKLLKETCVKLEEELHNLEEQAVDIDQIEADKAFITKFTNLIATEGVMLDAPFELKRRVVKIVVDEIILNTKEQRFVIKTCIPNSMSIEGSIGNTQARRRTHNCAFFIKKKRTSNLPF